MANSHFVVINAELNKSYSESVWLVSSLSVLIVLLVVHGSHICCGTHGWPKVSFHFQSAAR